MKIKVAGKEIEIDDATLAKAIEDKATEISVDSPFIIRTKDENDTFITNLKDEQIKVGKEIGIKDFKKLVGLDNVEGKDYQVIADAFKQKVIDESGISIDDKEKRWKADLETLKSSNIDLLASIDSEKTKSSNIQKQYRVDRYIDTLIPTSLTIPREDMALILSSKYDFGISDDNQFVAKDKITGSVLQDAATLSPTPFKDVIGGFFETNKMYLPPVDGGAGGDDSGGSGKTSVDAYAKTLNDAGHATNSESFNAEMQQAITAGTVSLED